MPPFIRPYTPSDHTAVEQICLLTANNGTSAKGMYALGDDLMANLFTHPYTHFHPNLAFVLDDGTGAAVGYIVGTPNTPAFVTQYREEWIPKFLDKYPAPPADFTPSTGDEVMLYLHHNPQRLLLPELETYPSHLHIDLLPDFQGKGFGKQLMKTFLNAARGLGVDAVHVGMVTANVKARGFYDKMEFHVIDVPDPGPLTYLGRSTVWKEI
ncbi:hypothetical protein HDV00_007790 [Rhizophlyctis rosea]|nr:hypothetical protein HDV00_007790 [Rhizophlyctis rosea]